MTADVEKSEKKVARAKRASVKPSRPNSDNQLGMALRSIYDDAVSEQIPSEMLDLLGKLH